jgi:hypothetical protein
VIQLATMWVEDLVPKFQGGVILDQLLFWGTRAIEKTVLYS